jgi:N-acetylneuraminic acid mutarotase
MSCILLFFFITGSFVTAFNPVSALELVEDTWNTKPLANQTRKSFEVVGFEGKLYAIGGFYYTEIPYPIAPIYVENYLGTNERYDPVADTWDTLEPMPTPRVSFAIAAYDGKIYCIGGRTDETDYYLKLGLNEVYDIATDSWSTKASPPFTSEFFVQVHVVGGKIFVRTLYELFMYDPVKDSWIEKTQIPYNTEPRNGVTSTMVDDKVIVLQLVESDYPRDNPNKVNIMIYDPKIDVWTEGQVIEIAARSVFITAGVTTDSYASKTVYVLGYRYLDSIPMKSSIWAYDPIQDVWSTAKAVPANISFYCVAVVDDILYVFGSTENGETIMQYTPVGYGDVLPLNSSPTPSDGSSSSKAESLGTFLTGSVKIIIVFTVSAAVTVTALLFYLRGKNKFEGKYV